MRGRLLAMTLLSWLAVSAGPAQAQLMHAETAKAAATAQAVSSPFRYTEVSVQPTSDVLAGAKEADLAYQAGFNTVRMIMPWTYPWQNDAVNDAPRVCSVASEAAVHHMTLFLDLVPVNGTPPVTATQITWYDKTLAAYMAYLISPKGCAQGLQELDIQVDNEPNYEVFRPQATAPEDYTHLLIRTWRSVHREAAKDKYAVPVNVIGGELASSHDPVDFMNRMEAEAVRWHVHGPFFDLFSYHCYGTSGLGITPPGAIQAAMVTDFGQGIPLLCSEFATSTVTPSSGVSAVMVSQSEGLQAQTFCQAESMAIGSGLAGFGWFRLMDDPTGAPTGLYYYDGSLGHPDDHLVAKSSLPGITQDNTAATSGDLSCG